MRIISKHNDYYDGVSFSDYPVWERKEEEISINHNNILTNEQIEYCSLLWDSIPRMDRKYNEFTGYKVHSLYDKCILGFCGKLYIVYKLFKIMKKRFSCIERFELVNCFVDVELYKKHYDSIHKHKNTKDNNGAYISFNGFFIKKGYPKSYQEWLDRYNNNETYELFQTLNTPLFMIYEDKLTTNFNMRDEGFTSLFEIYSVYQDIERFVGNDLSNQMTPDCIMTDELKVHAHGYDKMSFRMGKGTKKPRRKNKKDTS